MVNSLCNSILRLEVKKNQDNFPQKLTVKSRESLDQVINPLIKELQTLGVNTSSWSRIKVERIDNNHEMLSDKLMDFLQSSPSISDWINQVIVKVVNEPEYFKGLELLLRNFNSTFFLSDILLGILIGLLITLVSFILWSSKPIEKINQRKLSYKR